MKIYSIAWIALLISGFCDITSDNSSTQVQSNFSADSLDGMYVVNAESENLWNDSIQIQNGTLTVFKDRKYG